MQDGLNVCIIVLNNIKVGFNLVSEITVIHGYSSKVLQQYVRKQYHHKRARRKILTMNAGETIILLK